MFVNAYDGHDCVRCGRDECFFGLMGFLNRERPFINFQFGGGGSIYDGCSCHARQDARIEVTRHKPAIRCHNPSVA